MATKFHAPRGRLAPLYAWRACAGALMLLATCSWALAQSAAILPNAKTQFIDKNGAPFVAGKVFTFVPNTTSSKTTWSDPAEANPNTNPVILDSAGSAFIFGQGNYTEALFDQNNNLIWSGFTSAPGTSVPSGGGAQDTAPVGSVMPFGGFVPPTNWLLAYGQAISRATYAQLLGIITLQTSAGVCSGSQIAGFSNTSQMFAGEAVEASCVPSNTTITSIVNGTTIAVSNATTSASGVTATVFPWGNGDGSTTFNVPDLRGRTFAGADAMGGSAAGRLTAGPTPAIAAGSQNVTLSQANLPNVSFTNSGITVSTPTGTISGTGTAAVTGGGSIITSSGTGANLTGGGGVYGQNAVTIAGSSYSFSGAAQSIGQGSAASGGSGTALSVLQPTLTVNYIIKVLPSASGLGGVVSLGGLFGDIVCGTTLSCSLVGGIPTIDVSGTVGNIIGPGSSTIGHLASWNNGGGSVLADSGIALTNVGRLSAVALWTGAQTFADGKLLLGGSTSGSMTLKAPAIASTYVMTFPAATDTVAVLGAAQTFSGNETFSGQIIPAYGTPTIASGACGATTNGTLAAGSTNQSGEIIIASASTASCTVSFSATLSAAPLACIVGAGNSQASTEITAAYVSAITTGHFVLTGTTLASTDWYYHCF